MVLSPKAQALVKDYVKKYLTPKAVGEDCYTNSDGKILYRLSISIYARTENADTAVLDTLGKYIINLSDYFSDDEIATLLAEYPALVMYCHEHWVFSCSADEEKYFGGRTLLIPENDDYVNHDDGQTPRSIILLCRIMAKCKPGSHIYLPFAGCVSFALYLPKDSVYDIDMVEECSKEDWAYSKILLSSQGIDANMECQDSRICDNVATINIAHQKYDYIFSRPPMQLPKSDLAKTFLYLAQNALNDGGELYCLLPPSFCYEEDWCEFRKTLLKESGNAYSATVIELPPLFDTKTEFLPYHENPICLLCLKKDGNGIISLMDVSSIDFISLFDIGEGILLDVLSINKIIEILKKQDKEHVWVGKSIDLPNDADIYPFRYIIRNFHSEPTKEGVLYKLSELVDIVPFDKNLSLLVMQRNKIVHGEISDISEEEKHMILEKYNEIEKQKIPVVSMKGLSTSYLNCGINYDNRSLFYKKNGGTSDYIYIGYDVLRSRLIKVGRIHGVSEGTPIAVSHSYIVAVKLVSNAITEDFLLRCIMSESFKKQAEYILKRNHWMWNIQDLLSITVMVPKQLSEQERLCKEDAKNSLVEANSKFQENAESFRRDIHMKKHSIGQTIFNLNNWMKTLQRARKEGNGIVDDNAVVGKNKTKVSEIYANLQYIMKELQTKISKLDSGYGLLSSKIWLIDFIEEYCQKHRNPNFRYEFDAKAHRVQEPIKDKNNKIIVKKGEALESVMFPEEALTMIFDNIISNACNHGFENIENPNNIVKIEIKPEGEKCVVEISNNGKPLLSGYDSEDVLTYGVSSKEGKGHYGIGGYEVRKLMQEFNGNAEFISNPKDEFTVTYRLIFKNPYYNPNYYERTT